MIDKKIITQGERMSKYLWLARSPFENKQSALDKLESILKKLSSDGLEPWRLDSIRTDDGRAYKGYVDTNMTLHLGNGHVFYNNTITWARENKENEIKHACVLGERGQVRNWLLVNDLTPEQMITILRSVSHYNFSFDKLEIEPCAPFLRFSYIEREKYARVEIIPETGDIETYYHSGLNRLLPLTRLKIEIKEGRRKENGMVFQERNKRN